MENAIILGLVLVVLVLALLRAKKHFRGGCCSSGSGVIREKKTLSGTIICTKTLTVEGMHCENCEARLENALNRLEGVLCKASHKRGTARVSCTIPVSDGELKAVVEKLGYKVRRIEEC